MSKCYFEDATTGYKTSGHEHKLSKQEIIEFANTWDPMPFHVDEEAAKNGPYGGLTASGAHVYSIFVRLAHKQPRKLAVIAALGVEDMKFLAPVRPGDVIYLLGECISSRESSSKDDRGISTFLFKLLNQDDKVVFQLTQPLMLAKRKSTLDVFSIA